MCFFHTETPDLITGFLVFTVFALYMLLPRLSIFIMFYTVQIQWFKGGTWGINVRIVWWGRRCDLLCRNSGIHAQQPVETWLMTKEWKNQRHRVCVQQYNNRPRKLRGLNLLQAERVKIWELKNPICSKFNWLLSTPVLIRILSLKYTYRTFVGSNSSPKLVYYTCLYTSTLCQVWTFICFNPIRKYLFVGVHKELVYAVDCLADERMLSIDVSKL